jgi:hypothetical protein
MMIAAPHPSLLVSLGVAALIGWRMVARVRRMIGRQALSRRRARTTVILFPLLFVLLCAGSLAHPASLLALVVGAGLGAALGAYGLRLTRFEATSLGLFYTPSAHLGIALSALFIGRIGYRLVQGYLAGTSPTGSGAFIGSPLTAAIFGMLAGYYVGYAAGLLRWAGRASATHDQPQSVPGDSR